MIFAKNDSSSDAAAFENIGYSMTRYRRRNWLERWIRNLGATHAKPSPISLPRLVWLICLLYFGIFLVRTGLTFCSSALDKRNGKVSVYSITAESGKGNIRLR
jgi:hypothetical protein